MNRFSGVGSIRVAIEAVGVLMINVQLFFIHKRFKPSDILDTEAEISRLE